MFAARKVASEYFSKVLSRNYHKLCRPLKQCCHITRTSSPRIGLESFHSGIERYTVGFVLGRHTICTSADNSSEQLPWKER